ncbi:Putative transport protein [Rhizobiaceae bacterium]|nr:Putative transport protein [Rhizobiaceae bacterium]
MSVRSSIRRNAILAFMLVAISVAFGWILWPFAGAILWAVLLSSIFSPLYRALLRWMPERRNLASSATVLLIAFLVVIPLTAVASALLQEVSGLAERFRSGELDLERSFLEFRSSLPNWAGNALDGFASSGLPALKERLATALTQGWQLIAQQALALGKVTVDFLLGVFVMLYLLFYLLRDGQQILAGIQRAIPLPPEQNRALASSFTATVRGVLKGDLVVALVQGVLGGLIFWILGIGAPILWGALMAVLSLLPVLGTSLVWAPAAVYLLLSGSVWKGLVLLVFGTLLISTIDNFLRPLLVGTDVKMPSYVVLISSLGGIAIFGVNGFVIGPLIAALFLALWEIFLQAGDL